MAGEIKHYWTGTVLTIESDSGTSSMDLQGPTGDQGCRGPQGPAGIIVNADGTVDFNGYATETWVNEQIASVNKLDLNNYYTKSETDNLVSNIQPDLDGYATESYVSQKIAEAQLESTDVDLSAYATKEYVEDQIVLKIGDSPVSVQFENYVSGIISILKINGSYKYGTGTLTLNTDGTIKIS